MSDGSTGSSPEVFKSDEGWSWSHDCADRKRYGHPYRKWEDAVRESLDHWDRCQPSGLHIVVDGDRVFISDIRDAESSVDRVREILSGMN